MQIGFARRDISPPLLPEGDLSLPMLGFRWERAKAYRSIHDPLYARAMAVQTDSGAAVVVSLDLFGDVLGFTGRCAEEIERRCGVPAGHVLFGCTHTHTSPDTLRICRHEVAAWWVDDLTEQIVQTVLGAVKSARPASVRWAEADAPGLVINRRRRVVEAFEAKHGALDPAVRRRNTFVDETLRVLVAVGEDRTPLGAVVNFACHPVIIQTAPVISADYCGPAAGGVEAAMGSGFVSLYLNGPCGDINPACGYTGRYADCETTGAEIARRSVEVIGHALRGEPLRVEPVSGRIAHVEAARQRVPDAEALRAQEKDLMARCRQADAAGIPANDQRHPLSMLTHVQEKLAVEDMPRVVRAPVHVLRLGEARFVSLPGEILAALGQDVRAGVGGKVMIGTCARGHLGYVCPREAYRVGGYELGPGTWSWLAEGAGEAVVQAALDAARETG